MREILFRGKRLDNGNWVEGYYVKSSDMFVDGTYDIIFRTDVVTCLDIDKFDGYRVVRPETVGQYAGLKDKNGKKIFEGDIMRNAGNVVEFCSDGFCINGDSSLSLWTTTEVIGNIHDNPELLEVK